MEIKKFKVREDTKAALFLLLLVLIFVTRLIYKAFHSPDLAIIAFLVLLVLLTLIALLPLLVFCVTVTGDGIAVRTDFGRRYSFHPSDIDKVRFEKGGKHYFMIIHSKGRKVKIGTTLTGFGQLTQYLLEQREVGVIKRSAFTPNVIQELKIEANIEKNKMSKEELRIEKELATPLKSYNTKEKIEMLLKKAGFWGENNCYFITYGNTAAIFKKPEETPSHGSGYNAYIINKTEKGFGMIPLKYNLFSFKPKPFKCIVLEQYAYFVPNENVEKVGVELENPLKSKEKYRIKLTFDDRYICHHANISEPQLPFLNVNIKEFIDTYNKKRTSNKEKVNAQTSSKTEAVEVILPFKAGIPEGMDKFEMDEACIICIEAYGRILDENNYYSFDLSVKNHVYDEFIELMKKAHSKKLKINAKVKNGTIRSIKLDLKFLADELKDERLEKADVCGHNISSQTSLCERYKGVYKSKERIMVMGEETFKIHDNKKDKIGNVVTAVGCWLITILMIDRKQVVWAAIMGIVSIMMSDLWFCIHVTESTINVRTKFGRKYSFFCTEIDRVTCETIQSIHSGSRDCITIVSKGKEVQLSHRMVGFSQMAGHLLNQYKVNSIRKNAISLKAAHTLERYADSELYEMSKREKFCQNETSMEDTPWMDFSDIYQVQALLERIGCLGENNCYFVAYTYESQQIQMTNAIVDDRYDCYLINKNEKGFGMIPLRYVEESSIDSSHIAVLEKEYYFIPEENVKGVAVKSDTPPKEPQVVAITLEFDEWTINLLASVSEPALSYQNNNLHEFINKYTT